VLAALRLGGILLLFIGCVPLHVGTKLIYGRSRWPKRFMKYAARICGAQVRVRGGPLRSHTLLVCNHTSWLDIPVLASATGCAFVSKHELGHSLVHWMADQNNTVYVRRDHRRGSADQAEAIVEKLKHRQPLALFPEGTTGPGTDMLPFRSTLFAAVAPPPPGVTVRPVAIDYYASAPELGWYEEPGLKNVLRTLGRPQGVRVTVRLLDPLPPMDDRKALAEAARSAIAEALASSRARATL